MTTAAAATWLIGSEGRALLARSVAALDAGDRPDRVLVRLRDGGVDTERAGLVLEAADARRRARADWPAAESLVFTRRSLEQASRPIVSAWRARRFAGEGAVDLCSGAGGDAAALASVAGRTLAVELDPGRAVLLRHNLAVLAPGAEVLQGDALAAPVPTGVPVHVDPDRRANGRRVRDPARYLPSVRALDARYRAVNALGVTVGPGIDLDHPLLSGAELEFIQVGGHLVEAVRWSGDLRSGEVRSSASLLPGGHHEAAVGPAGPPLPVRQLGDVLLEPAAALVRARLHDRVGEQLGSDLGRVARRSALLTADSVPDTPWLTARRVIEVLPARPRAVRARLATDDLGPLEIALSGLEADVEGWWRELGRPPRGPGGVRLDLVRLDHGARAILSRSDAGDRPAERAP